MDTSYKQQCEKTKLQYYIQTQLNPLLSQALESLCEEKPNNALEFIASYLLINNPEKYKKKQIDETMYRKLTDSEIHQLQLEEQDRLMISHLTHERSFQESKQSLKQILKRNRETLKNQSSQKYQGEGTPQDILALSNSLSLLEKSRDEILHPQHVIQQSSDENDDESELIEESQLKKYQYQRYSSGTVRIVQKSQEMEQKIKFRLKSSELSNILSPEELMILARAIEQIDYSTSEWIIKPGDHYDGLYLFDSGNLDAYMNSQHLRSYHQNEFLAPIELFGGQLFGLKAKSKSTIFLIDKGTFDCVVKIKLVQRRERILKCVDVKGIALDAFQEIQIKAGTSVIQQGEEYKQVYFIENGTFHVTKNDNNEVIRTLESMDHFGEVAPIKKVNRTATVKAQTDAILFMIEGDLFNQLIFPQLEEKFTSIMENYS